MNQIKRYYKYQNHTTTKLSDQQMLCLGMGGNLLAVPVCMRNIYQVALEEHEC